MTHKTKTEALLKDYNNKYPVSQVQDIFKFLHQSSFGCEHMIKSLDTAEERIRSEAENFVGNTSEKTEPLDGDYSRVSLAYVKEGLSVRTLAKLFYMSAKTEPDGMNRLKEKLSVAKALAEKGVFSFSYDDFLKACEEWKNNGYEALHHSEIFRKEYNPSYRVVSDRFVPFLPLLARLDTMLQKGAVRLAVDGGSASGKSTLSKLLEELYGCSVFHMDDFFLQPQQRTKERLSQIGGNVDRERFESEVLIPVSRNETVSYRRFDCSRQEILPPVDITPQRLTLIEGAYSMHTSLSGYYDLSVFLDVDKKLQKERILKRNGEMAERFFNEWIPLEERYFDGMNVRNRCCMTIYINK